MDTVRYGVAREYGVHKLYANGGVTESNLSVRRIFHFEYSVINIYSYTTKSRVHNETNSIPRGLPRVTEVFPVCISGSLEFPRAKAVSAFFATLLGTIAAKPDKLGIGLEPVTPYRET